MTFRDLVGVKLGNTNTLFGKHVEFLSVMSGGTFNLSFNLERLQRLAIFIKPSYVFWISTLGNLKVSIS